ncbi:hypothetical protein KP509_05G014500 [Ceratopteris richardii]|uniref:Gnk2-homologous domain-containing protein n=1 Tax=Ceratopteris richardii TaxID=49495 RepID=A0A8T2ULM2_CERRI|nr:hypothetical protein KP509_05G014500 [Ceratopteris richardii]
MGNRFRFYVLPFAVIFLIFCSAFRAAVATSTIVLSATCDPRGMIPQGSPFWGHVGFVLEQLVENTPYTPNYSFKTRVGGGDSPAFGEAYCRPFCSPTSCQACLRQLSSDIWRICNSALGARVEYPECWMHYECYSF